MTRLKSLVVNTNDGNDPLNSYNNKVYRIALKVHGYTQRSEKVSNPETIPTEQYRSFTGLSGVCISIHTVIIPYITVEQYCSQISTANIFICYY